jgi:hypothetical protein
MKKSFVYFVLFVFIYQFCFSQKLDKQSEKNVKNFIDNIKNNRKLDIADNVKYPIYRSYPIPEIKNKNEFIKRYDEIFDEKLKNQIIKSSLSKDWALVGERGIMLYNGLLWLDDAGTLISVNYQSKFENNQKKQLIANEKKTLHFSIAKFKEPICFLQTSKYKIRIDDLGNENLRYSSWRIDKPMTDKPDLVITNGKIVFDGMGGNHYYDFINGNFRYECYIILVGADDSPPGYLSIYENKKEILSQDINIVRR